MKRLKESSLALGLVLLVFLTGLQELPGLLDKFFSYPVSHSESTSSVFNLDIQSLETGEYYFSMGRPRFFCDILKNGELIFKGRTSIKDKRPSLLVGAGFFHSGGPLSIVADCRQHMTGFQQRLTYPPKLYGYTTGVLLHSMRSFIDMGAGPIACLFLMVSSLLNHFLSKSGYDNKRSYVFILFSVIALLYSVSLAHFTRTIFNGMLSSQLHIVLRTLFSLGMASLLHPSMYPGLLLTSAHVAICAVTFLLPILPISIESFYLFVFPIYPLTTFFTLYASKRELRTTQDAYFLEAVLMSWGIAQGMDWVKQLSGIGYFAAPLYLGAIATYLTYRVGHQQSRLIKANALSRILESIVNANSVPTSLVKEIGSILHSHSCFDICSTYIRDTFVGNDGSSSSVIKLMSVGSTSSPEKVELDPIESPVLVHALKQKNIVEGTGEKDSKPFLVIPVGDYAVYCFTSSYRLAPYAVGEFKHILELIAPSLNLLHEKMRSFTSLNNSSLSKLRSTYGEGTFSKRIGAIFIDIADYSKNAEEYGEEYTSFISSSLIPAMIKTLKDVAIPEVVRGDEVLFIVIDESPNSNRDIANGVTSALKILAKFLSSEGQTISSQNGFGKLEFRVGFTMGDGTVVVDDVQTRTSGDHINRAKRLQDNAGKGEFFSDADTMKQLNSPDLLSLARKSIVVKKNMIEAVKVGVKRAA